MMTRHVFLNKKLLEAEVVGIMEEPEPRALLLAFYGKCQKKVGNQNRVKMFVTALLWFFQKISPILTVIGALVLFGSGFEGYEFIVGAVLAVLGLIVGWSAWGQEVPPRWFWVKLKLELFDNRVWNAFSYALQFFLIPFGVTGIITIVDML